jgi:transposase InsO family protein
MELGVRQSHSRTGQCWDNAVGESFFATIKSDLPEDGVWSTRASAHKAIFEYIEADYNILTLPRAPRARRPWASREPRVP